MDGKKKDKPPCEVRGIQCRKARREYTCFGCNGEVPILKGLEYYRVTKKTVNEDGKVGWVALRLCQRCREMMRRKLERAKNGGHRVQLSPGSFCYARLGKDDRAWWDALLDEAGKRKMQERGEEIKEYLQKFKLQQQMIRSGQVSKEYDNMEARLAQLDDDLTKDIMRFFAEEIKWRNAVDEVDKELQGGGDANN